MYSIYFPYSANPRRQYVSSFEICFGFVLINNAVVNVILPRAFSFWIDYAPVLGVFVISSQFALQNWAQ